ncbi:hypothetical protein MP638_004384, partial [Amoeboaphelidium occidentale]
MPPKQQESHSVVVVGSGGVGKSCLTIRFLKDEFSNEYDPTIEENYRKIITVDDSTVIINIVDTAGQQEYTALRDQHLQSGEGFLLVFAINDKNSFQEVKQLRESIVNLRNTSRVPFVVAGNKCDMESAREVDKNVANQWCQSIKSPYMETSAKSNINVTESFHQLIREIWRVKPKGSGGGKGGKEKKGGG